MRTATLYWLVLLGLGCRSERLPSDSNTLRAEWVASALHPVPHAPGEAYLQATAMRACLPRWEQQGLVLKYLPSYSPELNLIEHLWRRMKYAWMPFSAYASRQALSQALEELLVGFGTKYHITFSQLLNLINESADTVVIFIHKGEPSSTVFGPLGSPDDPGRFAFLVQGVSDTLFTSSWAWIEMNAPAFVPIAPKESLRVHVAYGDPTNKQRRAPAFVERIAQEGELFYVGGPEAARMPDYDLRRVDTAAVAHLMALCYRDTLTIERSSEYRVTSLLE